MPFAAPRDVDFTPLRNFDAEDNEDHDDHDEGIHDDGDGGVGGDNYRTPVRAPAKRRFLRAIGWILCSATTIYTTKRLMITHGHHYPLAIALRSFAVLLFLYTVAYLLGDKSGNTHGGKLLQLGIRRPGGEEFLSRKWVFMIPASLSAAASLPMLFEGLLHMPSLPVLIMLFPMVYAAESHVLFICYSPSRSQKWLPWEAIVATIASAIVLYNEYRLMVPGLIWGVSGVLAIGLSRACFIIGSERCGSTLAVESRLEAYHGFAFMTLVFGIIISGMMAYVFEHIESIYPTSLWTIALMVLNTASVVGTAFFGTYPLAFSPISFEDAKPCFSDIPTQGPEFLASTVSSLAIVLVAINSSPVPCISWIQIMAYLIATICLAGGNQVNSNIIESINNIQQQFNEVFHIPTDTRKPSRAYTGGALFILLMFFSWPIFSLSTASLDAIPPSLPTTLDRNYNTPSRFDIVVSIYDESPIFVKNMLDSIKVTKHISTFTPRVIIYTKHPSANLDILRESTNADVVERLDNLGREGGTYLHHIVNKWDELAEQTMFIQAHAHNMRELIPRINEYLVPQTGMLSLGFTGVVCDCDNCGDRWGWEDQFSLIPSLYEKIHHTPCIPHTPILLSYKGQFIASARRIRGISREVFEGLLGKITNKVEGVKVDVGNGVGESEDTPDNPFFGFEMERVWSLVMQCGTNRGIASRCPSLLSGMSRGGSVGDCQCLDEM